MKISKLIKIFLLFLIVFCFVPISVFSKTIDEAKQNPIKGIIYNPQTNSTNTSVTINDYNYSNGEIFENGDVEVKKVVTKINDNGLYNIEFLVRGKEEIVTKTKDTYIVFVLDRSYTMKDNNRWIDAKKAIKDISFELSKIDGITMALVGFSGGKTSSQNPFDDTVTLRENFNSKPFTDDEIGNYDTDNQNGGGTNIQAGLLKANELLADKIGKKYVILLSDGVPTFYYDENGYTVGSGNSDTKEKIMQVPDCKDAAINASQILKNNDIEIYTIGYQLDKLINVFTNDNVVYNEKELAIETLIEIASSNNHYFQSDSNTINTLISILKTIQVEMTTFKAGYNPTIIDNVGFNFKLDDSNAYGGIKEISSNSEITDTWQSIGNFNINIDSTLQKGWYKTNENFTFKYEKNTGEIKIIKCTDNPEVYWEQDKYQYQINYYFNNILDKSLTLQKVAYLDKDIFSKDYYLENINKQELQNKNGIDNTNYFIDINNPSNTSSIKIKSNVKENVINIYYVDTNFTNEHIKKNSNVNFINNKDTIIPYTIEYKVDINNVRINDKIVTKIIDKLPFKIDKDKSNLNGGIYNEEEKTITWFFNEEVEASKEIYKISKKIDYNVKYLDFVDASKKDNYLINNVSGYTKLNEFKTKGVSAKNKIDVEINGNVIINYITKDNKKLFDTIVVNNLIGSNYETIKKEFTEYSFIEIIGEANGVIKEEDTYVTYIYDLVPLPPHTGIKDKINNQNYISIFIFLIIIPFIISKIY